MRYAIAALPGVAATCLLAWLFVRAQAAYATERAAEHKAHREEVAAAARALLEQVQLHRVETDALTTRHQEQIDALLNAHRREVANLCQRLQAPQIAVGEHMSQHVGRDPANIDIENDDLLAEIARREQQVAMMENSLRARAEELAVEP